MVADDRSAKRETVAFVKLSDNLNQTEYDVEFDEELCLYRKTEQRRC